ncbi:MAG: hypothetical protein IT290_12820 [Deltaproteobacteria bacterium]|nr:hypothetical protein [Deltaproteobacteria bacterium]
MRILAAALPCLFATSVAWACDPCALYSATRISGHTEGNFTLSVNEQYTNFDRVSARENESIQDGEAAREYSTTMLSLGYDLADSAGVQLSLPIIARRFDEYTTYRASSESETGIGDATLAASYTPISKKSVDEAWIVGVFGGVKFPTGDSGSLEEAEPQPTIARHHPVGGGSSGRALSLGSGSFDFPLGMFALTRLNRAFVLANVQYTIRTQGDFDYEFADDLVWSAGPGAYVLLHDDYTVALRAVLGGEAKGRDQHNGALVDGSAITETYLGPEVIFTVGPLSGELGVDFRVTDEDGDALVVPDFRVRAGLSYRFG